jgi:hypothetical protein
MYFPSAASSNNISCAAFVQYHIVSTYVQTNLDKVYTLVLRLSLISLACFLHSPMSHRLHQWDKQSHAGIDRFGLVVTHPSYNRSIWMQPGLSRLAVDRTVSAHSHTYTYVVFLLCSNSLLNHCGLVDILRYATPPRLLSGHPVRFRPYKGHN